jgi:hypothetical protein
MARTRFTVEVHPSVKITSKARGSVAVAIGSAAAAELARLDLGGRVAFIPDIKWPGGRIIDLRRFLTQEQFEEIGIGR